MKESQYSRAKTSELLRVLNDISFQVSILALNAGLDRREGDVASGAAAEEIRGLTAEAARRLAFPAAQDAQAPSSPYWRKASMTF